MTKGYRRIIIDGICLGFHIDGFNNHLLEWKGQLAKGGVLMKYEIAKKENIEQIYQLVQNTINAIYPLYYPQGVVEFFAGFIQRKTLPQI